MGWRKTISWVTWVQKIFHGVEVAMSMDTQSVTATLLPQHLSTVLCDAAGPHGQHTAHLVLLSHGSLRQERFLFLSWEQKPKCLERAVHHLGEENMGSDVS